MESKQTALEILFEKIVQVSIDMQESVARIDERVRSLIEHQVSIETHIKEIISDQRDMTRRVLILEAKNLDKIIEEINKLYETDRLKLDKLNSLETKITRIENINAGIMSRVLGIVDIALKGLFGVLIAFILYKLGVNPSLIGK